MAREMIATIHTARTKITHKWNIGGPYKLSNIPMVTIEVALIHYNNYPTINPLNMQNCKPWNGKQGRNTLCNSTPRARPTLATTLCCANSFHYRSLKANHKTPLSRAMTSLWALSKKIKATTCASWAELEAIISHTRQQQWRWNLVKDRRWEQMQKVVSNKSYEQGLGTLKPWQHGLPSPPPLEPPSLHPLNLIRQHGDKAFLSSNFFKLSVRSTSSSGANWHQEAKKKPWWLLA